MIVIVTDNARTYGAEVSRLRDDHGAVIREMHPRLGREQVRSKLTHALPLLFPNVVRYRRAWKTGDDVIAMSWYLMPVLLLTKLHLVHRPRTIIAFGWFVNSTRLRRIAMTLVRWLRTDSLYVIAFSSVEMRELRELARVPETRMTLMPFRERDGLPAKPALEPEFIFAGGFANRDYDTFLAAVDGLDHPVFIAAAERNNISTTLPNVTVSTVFDPVAFEDQVARSRAVVVPLFATGGASGQSVILRAIERHKPLIVTSHPAIVDVLGPDFAGYVQAGDVEGLRNVLHRLVTDPAFERHLQDASIAARERIDSWPSYSDALVLLLRDLHGDRGGSSG